MWHENNQTEFKVVLNEKLEKEVVAFLNSQNGGLIYIGVDDDGNYVGNKNPDNIQLIISYRLKKNIEPSCLGLFDIIIIEKEKSLVIIQVKISRGIEQPCYIKKFGMSPKGCYLRVGSGVQQMERNMIDNLYEKKNTLFIKEYLIT